MTAYWPQVCWVLGASRLLLMFTCAAITLHLIVLCPEPQNLRYLIVWTILKRTPASIQSSPVSGHGFATLVLVVLGSRRSLLLNSRILFLWEQLSRLECSHKWPLLSRVGCGWTFWLSTAPQRAPWGSGESFVSTKSLLDGATYRKFRLFLFVWLEKLEKRVSSWSHDHG